MISAAVGRGGETMISAQTVEALWNAVEHVKPLVDRPQLLARARPDVPVPRRSWRRSRRAADLLLPERRAAQPAVADRLRSRAGRHGAATSASSPTAGLVNIAGGCCGNTPEHIAAIAKALDGRPPRAARCPRPAGAGAVRARPSTERAAPAAPLGLAAVHAAARRLHDDRRAHQRRRLAQVRQADQGGQVRGGGQRRPPAGRERRQRHRHLHGRGDDRRRRGDDALPARCSAASPRSPRSRSWSTPRSGR